MKNQHSNQHSNQQSDSSPLLPLFEALEYKDLEGIMKPEIHIDEFASKMGDDDDIIVISFFVRSEAAARDLVSWFEKGYEWVLDADQSPGEISPGRYLVYVEVRRRSSSGKWVEEMLSDLSTLTEYDINDWTMVYKDDEYPFSKSTFDALVPLSPKEYRKKHGDDLNEMRIAAGVEPHQLFEREKDIRQLQAAAGI